MTILSSAGVSANAPFCDALDLTVPREVGPDVDDALRPYFVAVHATAETPSLWRVPRVVDFEFSYAAALKPATVKLDDFGQVHRVSFSGGACDAFRKHGCYEHLLATLFQWPHRSTRLDATIDIEEHAPPLVAAVAAAGRLGVVHLGRKSVNPQDVDTHLGLDARGELTGSVYLGKPGREIRMKVYDKRHEIERKTDVDIGPTCRVEVSLRKVGATLRDAHNPSGIFWNYAKGVVTPPADAPLWNMSDTGFALPPKEEADAWELLRRRVDDWEDLRQLGLLADKLGPHGRSMLVNLIADALRVKRPVSYGVH